MRDGIIIAELKTWSGVNFQKLKPVQLVKIHPSPPPPWDLHHNNSPLGLIHSQVISVRIATPCFFKIHFCVMFSSMPRFSKWPLFVRCMSEGVVISYLPHLYYMPKPLLFFMWPS
jgi:hypothetical protein